MSPAATAFITGPIVAFLAVMVESPALDRPTRDQVDPLPVWAVRLCLAEPTADDRLCWDLTPADMDRAACSRVERAAKARFKGARSVTCLPDPEKLGRMRGWVVFAETPT